MHLIKVAAASLNQTPLDWDRNQANIVRAIRAARSAGVAVLCLPELCVPGYGCEDEFHSRGVTLQSWRVLQEVLPETTGIAVALGLPIMHRGVMYNAVCLVVDGKIAGLVAKRFLPGDGVHYEPRWFKPWPAGKSIQWKHDGVTYPLGDLLFEISGLRIGFEICEDAWVPGRPGPELAAQGVDIILNPSASHFAFAKHEVRKQIVLDASRTFGATYVYTNLIGNEAGRVIYDGEALIASAGKLLAEGPRFGFDDVYLTTAIIDIDHVRMSHSRTTFTPAVDDSLRAVVRSEAALPVAEFANPPPSQANVWPDPRYEKHEEFTRAVALGLFDYLRKSRSRGFVVSLSGGADSAAVAYLIAAMVELACQELGLAAACTRLHQPLAETPHELVRALLVCVYQATANSGPVTQNAARVVAEAVGGEFLLFDVEPLVRGYLGIFFRTQTWHPVER